MKIVYGYQNTKENGEDIALTPYIFGVFVNGKVLRVYGLGLCFIHWSFYIALGFGVPKNWKQLLKNSK